MVSFFNFIYFTINNTLFCIDNNLENTNQLNKPSQAEYVVCTKAISSNKLNPVLGFTLMLSPHGLVLFLATGEVVTLALIGDPGFLREQSVTGSNKNESSLATTISGQSFELHIKNILSSKVSNPILQLDKSSDPTPKEALELLMHATHVLREQYFLKHEKVKQEIEKRVKMLQLMKEQQAQDIAQLQLDKEVIRQKAENLAEKYEDICEKQQVLFKRAQDVVRLATVSNPQSAIAEQEFQQQIEKISIATKKLKSNIVLAKRNMGNQENQINQINVGNKAKTIVMQPRMENAVKELLSEM